MQQKQLTKAEALKKAEAWKTINSVLVKADAEFMEKLRNLLKEKSEQHDALKEKLEKGEGTEEENATCLFLGGYIQCLKDILGKK